MSSMIGEHLRLSIFGQSHGEAVGAVLDGLPAGEIIDFEALQSFMARRAPGRSDLSTRRSEKDIPRIVSGVSADGRTTCGAPLCLLIENGDTRSGDYSALLRTPRPSHADYPAHIRYGGHQDVRGGGHFSGRLTAPLCAAGGIAIQILARRGIFVGAHAEAVGAAQDRRFETVNLTVEELHLPSGRAIPTLDEEAGARMAREIKEAASEGDSVGGLVECAVIGVPAGLGDPMFGGLENRLAAMVMGIPGARGIEFGAGFAAAAMWGSAHNDPYRVESGAISTRTNHHGGILGGITTGMPIIFRVAFKPTSSIGKAQRTVDLTRMEETELTVTGRHDPCIALRAVPCVEAATALTLLDQLLIGGNH